MWDPGSSLGLPLAGRGEAQMFFPLEWPAIFGGPQIWSLMLILSVALAGLGTYLFVRRLAQSGPAALAGATVYMFSGYSLWFYTQPSYVGELMLLPWLFWIAEETRRADRIIPWHVGTSGVVIGLILLAGQPEIAILSLLGCALYTTLATALSPNPLKQVSNLTGFGISIPLGIGIAAVQIGLFSEALQFGSSLHDPGHYARTEVLSLLNFTSAVWPYLLGQLWTPWQPQIGAGPHAFVQESFPLLIGTASLFILSLAVIHLFASARHRKGLRGPDASALSLLFVLCVIMMLLLPRDALGPRGSMILDHANLIKHLWEHSTLNRVNFPRYVVPLMSLLIAGLVATGIDSLDWLTPRRTLYAFLVGSAGAAILAYPVVSIARVAIGANVSYMRDSIILASTVSLLGFGLTIVAISLVAAKRTPATRGQTALLLILVAETSVYVRYGLGLRDEYLRLMPFIATASCAVLVLGKWYRAVPMILVCASIGTLLILERAPNGLPKPLDPYAGTLPAYATFVKSLFAKGPSSGRILQTFAYLSPDYPASVGVAELPALTPVQVYTTSWLIFNALTDKALRSPDYTVPNAWPGMGSSGVRWDNYAARRRYYNLFGVRYIVDEASGWWSRRKINRVDQIYHDDDASVYEDKDALPRAFAVRRVIVAPNLLVARTKLLKPEINLRRTAILESAGDFLPEALISGPEENYQPVEIVTYSPMFIALETNFQDPELVVLTDTFYPGWTASVDGQANKIYRVDAAVRGIVVPSGRHKITMRYWPHRLSAWLTVSIGSVLLCILLCLIRRRRMPVPVGALLVLTSILTVAIVAPSLILRQPPSERDIVLAEAQKLAHAVRVFHAAHGCYPRMHTPVGVEGMPPGLAPYVGSGWPSSGPQGTVPEWLYQTLDSGQKWATGKQTVFYVAIFVAFPDGGTTNIWIVQDRAVRTC